MKKQFVLLLLLINGSMLRAQDSNYVTIKAGNRISEVLTPTGIFLHPKFIRGNVFFRSGTQAAALMNYNSLYDQMLFLGPKGDTLALRDEKDIHFITLAADTFYFNEGYIRLVGSNSAVKLAEKRVWEVADIRKMGSHDRQAKTFAVTSMRTYTDGFGETRDLVLNEDLVLRKKPVYYIGDQFNHFLIANKKNALHFSKEPTDLAQYLKENRVNFDKKEDLEKLVHVLEQKK